MRIKPIFSWTIIVLVLLLFSSHCFCSSQIELKDWQPFQGISNISTDNGILKVESSSYMPLLISPDRLFINTGKYNFLKIEMRSDKSYSSGRLFFKRIGDRDFNYLTSVELSFGINKGYHTYIIDLQSNPNWQGVVNQLLFQPSENKGDVEIKAIYLSEGNILLKIASFWQEFFRLERPLPRTINFIYGPKINGIFINNYIYFLIIMIAMILVIFFSMKHRDPIKALNISMHKMIIVCFIFWILLDIRTSFDQLRTAMLDFQVFGGKNLEEKQALSTFGTYYDFYYFLKFCSSKIPPGSSYALKVPSQYIYYDEKAKYYLYPNYEREEAEYLIVYDPQKLIRDEDIPSSGYKTFSVYKENQYVLKRITNL